MNSFFHLTEEQLITQEFTDYSFDHTSTDSWSVSKVYNCPANFYVDFSGRSYLGMLGLNETPSKTFTGLPPHWSLSVRFDVLLFSSLDYG